MPAIGPPGRAAQELPAGLPPLAPTVADHVLTEHATSDLEIRGASVRGLLHRYRDEPRQDDFSITYDRDTDTTVIVVCDGVGSLPRSHEAAALVVDRLPGHYWAHRDWDTAVKAVNTELQELASRLAADPDLDPEHQRMATTLVAVAIEHGPDGRRARIVRSDDSTAWLLGTDGTWSPAAVDERPDAVVHTGSVRALPAVTPQLQVLDVGFESGALFVMSDGVGDPLRDAPAVRRTLASWWATPPTIFEFGSQVGFARKSHLDDRTVVGAWILPAGGRADERAGTVRRQDLGALDFVAEGGTARVYRAGAALPGFPRLAYKELRNNLSADARASVLDAAAKAVAFRDSLDAAELAELDEFSTWPLAMVSDGGVACGLVMPLLPPDFFLRTVPKDGPPKDLVFELSWLSAEDSQVQVLGIDRSGVSDVLVRLTLLMQLCRAVGWLHEHGLVFGDLSLKNAALAVNPPRLMLLSCDAVASADDPGRVQLSSPFFQPPELVARTQRLQDERTDVYKLGLCVIRGLQRNPGVTQAKDPTALAGVLDPQAIDVLSRAVGSDRAARPSAREIYHSLEQNQARLSLRD